MIVSVAIHDPDASPTSCTLHATIESTQYALTTEMKMDISTGESHSSHHREDPPRTKKGLSLSPLDKENDHTTLSNIFSLGTPRQLSPREMARRRDILAYLETLDEAKAAELCLRKDTIHGEPPRHAVVQDSYHASSSSRELPAIIVPPPNPSWNHDNNHHHHHGQVDITTSIYDGPPREIILGGCDSDPTTHAQNPKIVQKSNSPSKHAKISSIQANAVLSPPSSIDASSRSRMMLKSSKASKPSSIHPMSSLLLHTSPSNVNLKIRMLLVHIYIHIYIYICRLNQRWPRRSFSCLPSTRLESNLESALCTRTVLLKSVKNKFRAATHGSDCTIMTM